MTIKVYNENGKIKVAKISASGIEHTMFSNIAVGEGGEITVEAALSVHGEKDSISW